MNRIETLSKAYALLLAINREITQLLNQPLSQVELFSRTCDIAVRVGGYRMAWIGMLDADGHRIEPVASCAGEAYLREFHIDLTDPLQCTGPTANAVLNGQVNFSNDLAADARMAPWQAQQQAAGFRSSVAIPIKVLGRPVGALSLYADRSGAIDAAQARLLEQIGDDIGYGLDVMAQQTTLQETLAEAKRFRDALDHVSAHIYMKNTERRYMYANRLTLELFGRNRETLLNAEDSEFFPPDTVQRLHEIDTRVLAGEDTAEEIDVTFPGGERRVYWEVKTPIYGDDHAVLGLTGISTDITSYKRMEESLAQQAQRAEDALAAQRALNQKLEAAQNQLLQAEKMASIGQLAAGVAHELNNPIGFVNSNLGSLETYINDLFAIADAYAAAEPENPATCPPLARVHALKQEKDYEFLRRDITQLIAESREGLVRVAKIVRDLKDFSRAGEAKWQRFDLHGGIDSTLNILWNEIKYTCSVTKDFGVLPPIWCEPSQLNQVFMNLLVNARQAIPEKGTITIRTGTLGAEVFVAITDTGTGIAPEHRNRLFEPFFTTKPIGKGTGLGLSLSWSIVQRHAGHIEVVSNPGGGTTFTVFLPIHPRAPLQDAIPPSPTFPTS